MALGRRSGIGDGYGASRRIDDDGDASVNSGGIGRRETFRGRVSTMASKLKDLGRQVLRVVVRIWSKVMHGILFLVDHILPPHYNSSYNANASSSSVVSGGPRSMNDANADADADGSMPRPPPLPTVAGTAANPSTTNNNNNNNYDAWRRWLYHVIATFLYPYLRRLTTNLLTTLASM
jgi:hypothetical protein